MRSLEGSQGVTKLRDRGDTEELVAPRSSSSSVTTGVSVVVNVSGTEDSRTRIVPDHDVPLCLFYMFTVLFCTTV